jgi:hypothetical protein
MKFFVASALLPPVALALLAMMGARQEVGVILTGSGPHAILGAAWVAVWLATVVLSPIAAGAALLLLVFTRLSRRIRSSE